jgi:hypothetical protein
LQSAGPVHNLPPNGPEIGFLSLFLDRESYKFIAQKTNNRASYCQKDMPDSKWRKLMLEKFRQH